MRILKRKDIPENGLITPHFSIHEMDCRDGTPIPDGFIPNVVKLCQQLEVIRTAINGPIHVNSCYRHPSYNRRVGGVDRSQHLTASAADITTKLLTPRQVAQVIKRLIKQGKIVPGGLGIYPGFVHYDVRGVYATWGK